MTRETTEEPHEPADLFRLRPDEFTAARNALAKRLKSEGHPDRAAEVQALRRPTVTAWALNQLARQRPDLVEGVIEAGEHLRQAMEKAMGGDRSEFQAAQASERNSVQEALDAASVLMEAGGTHPAEAARQRMTETLRAAAVDGSVADLLKRGVLETDISAAGFGLEGISADVLTRAQADRQDEDPCRQERQARLDELRRAVDEAERRLRAARAEAEEAEERAVRLRREADRAEKDLEAAAKRLEGRSGT